MKREHGLWYVKYHGVWLVAGTDIGRALRYKARVEACGFIPNTLDKTRQHGIN